MKSVVSSLLWICLIVFGVALQTVNAQTQIEIFSDAAIPAENISGVEVIYYDLSEPEKVKAKYLPVLPSDVERATQIFQSFLVSAEGVEFQQVMKEAYRGHQKMVSYQLEKIPAVVFDQGQYVVYGITDVNKARALYKTHRNQEAAP